MEVCPVEPRWYMRTDRQTDRQTDRPTDMHNEGIGLFSRVRKGF